jgi:uncharacterized protein with ACT and thioredoxin-like domain
MAFLVAAVVSAAKAVSSLPWEVILNHTVVAGKIAEAVETLRKLFRGR